MFRTPRPRRERMRNEKITIRDKMKVDDDDFRDGNREFLAFTAIVVVAYEIKIRETLEK
jgi:hypothetical protein